MNSGQTVVPFFQRQWVLPINNAFLFVLTGKQYVGADKSMLLIHMSRSCLYLCYVHPPNGDRSMRFAVYCFDLKPA